MTHSIIELDPDTDLSVTAVGNEIALDFVCHRTSSGSRIVTTQFLSTAQARTLAGHLLATANTIERRDNATA